jgi:hypothetical protein
MIKECQYEMMLPYIFLIFSLSLSHISRAYFFAKGVAFRYIGSGSGDFLFTDKRPSSSCYDFACSVFFPHSHVEKYQVGARDAAVVGKREGRARRDPVLESESILGSDP